MVNKNKTKRMAPYVSASSLSQFFDHIRYVSTPKKVDAGLILDYGIPKGQVFALISALKFLGLVDPEGRPTPAFNSLQVMGEEFISNLREVITNAYSDLFARLDVSRDSREHIRNFFSRNYSPSLSEKSTSLFLDLAKEAGIPVAALSEAAKKDVRGKITVPRPPVKRGESTYQGRLGVVTEEKAEIPLSDDELRKMYIARLVEQISPPDTSGKDADAIKAEAELRRAELDRIEKLIGITEEKGKEEKKKE